MADHGRSCGLAIARNQRLTGTPAATTPTVGHAQAVAHVAAILGGRIIHEVGCVRMGKDPKTSVLNSNCQAHDCRNLFLTDGGPFVTNPDKNVTWTILALAMRTSEYIANQRKAGSI